jgi:hypothetical protein
VDGREGSFRLNERLDLCSVLLITIDAFTITFVSRAVCNINNEAQSTNNCIAYDSNIGATRMTDVAAVDPSLWQKAVEICCTQFAL